MRGGELLTGTVVVGLEQGEASAQGKDVGVILVHHLDWFGFFVRERREKEAKQSNEGVPLMVDGEERDARARRRG